MKEIALSLFLSLYYNYYFAGVFSLNLSYMYMREACHLSMSTFMRSLSRFAGGSSMSSNPGN